MKIATGTTQETHDARVFLEIEDAEVIVTTEMRWMKGDVEVPFRPKTLSIMWRWSKTEGDWVLHSAVVRGRRILKNGSEGQRDAQIDYVERVRGGRDPETYERVVLSTHLSDDAPAEVRDAIKVYRPTSYVGGE